MSHFADVFAFAGCVEHLLDSRIKTFLNFPEGCLRIYVMAYVKQLLIQAIKPKMSICYFICTDIVTVLPMENSAAIVTA